MISGNKKRRFAVCGKNKMLLLGMSLVDIITLQGFKEQFV